MPDSQCSCCEHTHLLEQAAPPEEPILTLIKIYIEVLIQIMFCSATETESSKNSVVEQFRLKYIPGQRNYVSI